jgi:hypothetical protein
VGLRQHALEQSGFTGTQKAGQDGDGNQTHGAPYKTGEELKTIIKTVAKVLGITSNDMVSQIVPDYISLDMKYFKFINRLICDVFHQQKGSGQDSHFVKIFNENDKRLGTDLIKVFPRYENFYKLCKEVYTRYDNRS